MENNVWSVKAIYSSGGHYIADRSGFKLVFKTESAANDFVAMANMNKSDHGVSYIVVKES